MGIAIGSSSVWLAGMHGKRRDGIVSQEQVIVANYKNNVKVLKMEFDSKAGIFAFEQLCILCSVLIVGRICLFICLFVCLSVWISYQINILL
ncbi:hypothetical protein CLU79DRAFT_772627 [Phycomyces nitens]|nr:hypothetical protein CLU79DRAFT_772627 [Phycomyces nitens]